MGTRVACICGVYRPHSHADVGIGKLIHGCPTDRGLQLPRVQVVSLYIDQIAANDIGVATAAAHGIPVFPSICGALTLGGKELAVDGVVLIGEHGDYPENERGQTMYPRKYMFEQICGVLSTSDRKVPIFNDKHLSYNWADAKWMYDRAQSLGIPLQSGSSLPFTWRKSLGDEVAFLEHPLGTAMTEAIIVGNGNLDSFADHALEALGCMVERRAGGESGVQSVQYLEGAAVWEAGKRGVWSRDLAEHALQTIGGGTSNGKSEGGATGGGYGSEARPVGRMEDGCPNPFAVVLRYVDGFKATVLFLNPYIKAISYAARLASGEVQVGRVRVPVRVSASAF
jgi:hypothetical protein